MVTGEILLADVIDSDSWRLWPAGDRRLMKDKQVYRDLVQVTAEGLETVKRNFQWVADKIKHLTPKPQARVAVLMGSDSDMEHSEKIRKQCKAFGIPCELRVTSAHKGTEETMKILAEYEGASGIMRSFLIGFSWYFSPGLTCVLLLPFLFNAGLGIPTVFIAVAGRSNGLGPVLSGNASWPVINCPPVKADWGAQDVWSSLRMPSGE